MHVDPKSCALSCSCVFCGFASVLAACDTLPYQRLDALVKLPAEDLCLACCFLLQPARTKRAASEWCTGVMDEDVPSFLIFVKQVSPPHMTWKGPNTLSPTQTRWIGTLCRFPAFVNSMHPSCVNVKGNNLSINSSPNTS